MRALALAARRCTWLFVEEHMASASESCTRAAAGGGRAIEAFDTKRTIYLEGRALGVPKWY